MKVIAIAASLLVYSSLLAAQPVPVDFHDEVQREIETQFGDRLRSLETWTTVGATLLGVTLAGLIPAYVSLLRRARKIAEEKVAAAVDGQIKVLMEMLDEHDTDLALRRDTPILVLSGQRQTAGLLRQAGFLKATTLEPDKVDSETIPADSLVVFDLDHGCPEATASSLMTRDSLESVLVYTSGRSDLRGPQLTFANSPVTLFSRLMELIRFRKALARR